MAFILVASRFSSISVIASIFDYYSLFFLISIILLFVFPILSVIPSLLNLLLILKLTLFTFLFGILDIDYLVHLIRGSSYIDPLLEPSFAIFIDEGVLIPIRSLSHALIAKLFWFCKNILPFSFFWFWFSLGELTNNGDSRCSLLSDSIPYSYLTYSESILSTSSFLLLNMS